MENKDLATRQPQGLGFASVQMPEKFMGGLSFVRYRLDVDKGVFVNEVTGEEKPELLVRLTKVRSERVHLEESELLCSSKDTEISKEGVMCAACPRQNNSPFMPAEETKALYEKTCKDMGIPNPPPFEANSKCSLRLVVSWIEEFDKNEDGSYVWVVQPGLCYLSCGKSSLADMMFAGSGYISKLKAKGYRDLPVVVTAIQIGTRKNEKMKKNYSYETFTFVGPYEEMTKKCVNYDQIRGNMGEIIQSAAEIAQESHVKAEIAAAASDGKVLSPAKQTPRQPAETAQDASFKPVDQNSAALVGPAAAAPAQGQAKVSAIQQKMQVKTSYAKLPEEIKKDVLSALNIENIDAVAAGDLGLALEIIQMAQDEVNKATPPSGGPVAAKAGSKKPW